MYLWTFFWGTWPKRIELRVLNMIYKFFKLYLQFLGVFFHEYGSGFFWIGSGFLADPNPDKSTVYLPIRILFRYRLHCHVNWYCNYLSCSIFNVTDNVGLNFSYLSITINFRQFYEWNAYKKKYIYSGSGSARLCIITLMPVLLRTQEISVALLINPRNVGGEIRKTFVIKCAN